MSKRQSRNTSRDALRDHGVPFLSCWSAVLATWDIRSKIRGKVQYGKTCPYFEKKSELPLEMSKREEVFSVAFRYTESNAQYGCRSSMSSLKNEDHRVPDENRSLVPRCQITTRGESA